MRLNQLLQICVLLFLLVPLVKLSPSGMLDAGYEATMRDLRSMLDGLDRDGRLGDGGRELAALLSPSPQVLTLDKKTMDGHIRTAKRGYHLLRRVTDNDFVKNLAVRPAEAARRIGSGLAAFVGQASVENLRRAYEDPLRLPPELARLLSR